MFHLRIQVWRVNVSEEMPDWLNELQGELQEAPETDGTEATTLDDLRLQSQLAEPTAAPTKNTRFQTPRALRGFTPQQRFILAVLLYLDVAFIGFLFLVMLGRFAIF